MVAVVAVMLLSASSLSAQGTTPSTKQNAGKATASVNDPGGTPKDYRSQWFFLHTDLSGAEAQDLLKRLEKMLSLISRYWAKPPQKMIEIYVVKDLKNWPAGKIDNDAMQSLTSGGGITLTRGYIMSGSPTSTDPNNKPVMRDATAVCYAVADRGTPQHEAVHAYCAQTFGTTGPTWYSEGMAEMGQYWRDGENRDVQIHPGIIRYFQAEKVKSLNGIVNNRESTGDSWQNYAWRWALCHLLANNPNYNNRFRPLGLELLQGKNNLFEPTYGDFANEMSFEYKFFIENIDNGYRVDLCSFDWKKKFLPLQGTAGPTAIVLADRGWQPTQATVLTEKTYEYTATGSWQVSKESGNVGAAGDSTGRGRLVGTILQKTVGEYTLSEPFELGASGDFTPPANGELWVRCQDAWNELADNKGKLTLKLKIKP